MKEYIELPNRDGLRTGLKHIKDGNYLLDIELDTVGVTYFDNEMTEIVAIDPSGGPCIAVGGKIEGMTVKEITHSKELLGFIIKFDI